MKRPDMDKPKSGDVDIDVKKCEYCGSSNLGRDTAEDFMENLRRKSILQKLDYINANWREMSTEERSKAVAETTWLLNSAVFEGNLEVDFNYMEKTIFAEAFQNAAASGVGIRSGRDFSEANERIKDPAFNFMTYVDSYKANIIDTMKDRFTQAVWDVIHRAYPGVFVYETNMRLYRRFCELHPEFNFQTVPPYNVPQMISAYVARMEELMRSSGGVPGDLFEWPGRRTRR